jgi:hypothetical protein
MKTVILAAALAVGFAGFAGAAEVQKDKAPAPAVKTQKMSDSEMDRVTAGDAGYGVLTAEGTGNWSYPSPYGINGPAQTNGLGQNGNIPGVIPTRGLCTAGKCGVP